MGIRKLITTFALAATLAVPLSTGLIGDTDQANAASCGMLCDGTGQDNSSGQNPPTGGGNGNNSNGGGGSNGGGNGNGSGVVDDGSTWRIHYSKLYVADKCTVRSDGAKPVRLKIAYKEIYKNTDGQKQPSDGYQWKYEGYYPHAGVHGWSRFAHQYSKCLYGSAYVTKTLTCNINASVSLNMRAPKAQTLMERTGKTGYKEGSANYEKCKSSIGNVKAGITPTNYGFYNTYTWKRAQTLTVKIPVTKNEYTGSYDKLKVEGVSPAYNTTPRLGMTLSLDCKNAYKIPGVMLSKYWTETACEGSFPDSYVCSTPDVQVNIADTGKAARMKSVKNGSTLELLNDGKARLIQFNPSISGKNIKVKSYQHRYTRSGSPWDSSMSINKNLVELSKSTTGKSIWKNSGESAWTSGKGGKIYLSSIQASNPGSSTKLTHEVKWTGTKTIQSVRIDSINAETGAINLKPVTITVPTSGTCSSNVNLKYLRVVGGM